MARKRERRGGARADQQSDSSQTSSAEKPFGSFTEPDRNRTAATATTAATVILLIVVPVVTVIVYRILYTPSPATPDLPYVYRRGLVAEKIDYQQVLHVRLLDLLSSKFLGLMCLCMLLL